MSETDSGFGFPAPPRPPSLLKLVLQSILALVVLALGIYMLTRKSPAPFPAPTSTSAKTQATENAGSATQPVEGAPAAPAGAAPSVIVPTSVPTPLPAALPNLFTIAFAPDGRLLVAHPGGIEYHHLVTGMRQPVAVEPAGVREMSFSPAGDTIAIASPRPTVLWSVMTSSARRLADGGALTVRFSPDGRTLATGDQGGELRLWDANALSKTATLRPGVGAIAAIAFAPDGRTIAAAGQGVAVWELPANRPRIKVANNDAVTSAGFSSDGHILATARAGGVVLWETVFWQKLATLSAGQAVARFAFWRSGTSIVMSCADGSIQIWDVPTRTRTATLAANGPLVMFALGPDDRTLAAAGTNGVTIWDTMARGSRHLP